MPEKKLYDLTVDPEFRDLIPPLNEEELKLLDKVAYIRFASVYRSFEDIREFGEEIARLEK